VPADDNLNAVAWTQTAVEHDLVYLEVYRNAQQKLLAALHDTRIDALPHDERDNAPAGLKPAVVLDIDETVLDNSAYQARLVRSGGEYSEPDWAEWVREEAAPALPGALAFTRFAAAHGVAVIYISNRDKGLDAATLANLRKLGFPVSGPDAFLGLGTVVPGCEQVGTEKTCRRRLIARDYRVLMQFGDQVGDFVTVLDNTPQGRRAAMQPYLDWIGERWFVLPNVTYGSWEPALFHNDWSQPREQRRQEKLDALRYR
jgi:acid phosphatase